MTTTPTLTLLGTVGDQAFGPHSVPTGHRTSWHYDPDADRLVSTEHPIGPRDVLLFWLSVPTSNGCPPRWFRCHADPAYRQHIRPGDAVRVTGHISLPREHHSCGGTCRRVEVLAVHRQLPALALAS